MAYYGYCAWCQRNTQRWTVGQCGTCGRRDGAPEPSVVVCQLDGRVYDESDGPCPDCWERAEAERVSDDEAAE